MVSVVVSLHKILSFSFDIMCQFRSAMFIPLLFYNEFCFINFEVFFI